MCGLPVCAHACVRSSHDGNRTMERDYKRMRAEAAEQAKGQGLDGRVPAAEIKDALKRQKVAPEDEGGAGAAGGKEDSSSKRSAYIAAMQCLRRTAARDDTQHRKTAALLCLC